MGELTSLLLASTRVALLLAVVLYVFLPDDTSAIGMWGDFSWHIPRSRSQAGNAEVVAEGDDDPSSAKVNCSEGVDKEQKVKIRKKRYVTFPEGSSTSLAICLSLGVSDTNLIFTHGIGYGISFDLPNDSKSLRGDGKATGDDASREIRSFRLDDSFAAKRRDRRTLYQRIEEALTMFGVNGRACVLRTLCEAAQRFSSKGGLVQEFLRIIFTMPQLEGRHSWEGWDWDSEESKDYDEAHLHGKNNPNDDCAYHFRGCDFSLLEYLIG